MHGLFNKDLFPSLELFPAFLGAYFSTCFPMLILLGKTGYPTSDETETEKKMLEEPANHSSRSRSQNYPVQE